MRDSAERTERLRQAVKITDRRKAIEAIVAATGTSHEDASLIWSNEHGHGGDVIGGPDDDHERE